MKRKNLYILIFLYIIFTTPLCADIFNFDNHSLSIQIESGVFYGTAYELIYTTSHSVDYASELQWNIKKLWFVGAFFEYAPKNPLENNAMFFNFDLKVGIPSKTGVMEDRDWLDGLNQNVLTLFSSHDNKTTGAFTINSASGFSIPLAGNFLAKISLDFMMIYYEFEAWDGYTQYGTNTLTPPYNPWNPNLEKIPFKGLGIDYLQLWMAINPVFGIEWHGNKFVFISAFSFNTSIFCLTVDNHYVRQPPFTLSNLSGTVNGLLLEAKGSVFYKLSNNFNIGASLKYTSIDSRGDLTLEEHYENYNITRQAPNGGGSAYKVFVGGLIFKIVF